MTHTPCATVCVISMPRSLWPSLGPALLAVFAVQANFFLPLLTALPKSFILIVFLVVVVVGRTSSDCH